MILKLKRITSNPIELIYDAYRICYAKDLNSIELKKHSSIDGKIDFIKPLMANGHTSPLEHVNITFEISGVSRALLAQITRHRTASFNVQSQRYVNATNFNYVIPSAIENNLKAKEEFIDFMNKSKDFYIYLQEEYGIKNEDSRAVLPNATDCNMIVTFDLHNFRNFYGLRSCKHAQEEIRLLAEKMMELVKEHIPFADYKSKRCSRICNECFKRGE